MGNNITIPLTDKQERNKAARADYKARNALRARERKARKEAKEQPVPCSCCGNTVSLAFRQVPIDRKYMCLVVSMATLEIVKEVHTAAELAEYNRFASKNFILAMHKNTAKDGTFETDILFLKPEKVRAPFKLFPHVEGDFLVEIVSAIRIPQGRVYDGHERFRFGHFPFTVFCHLYNESNRLGAKHVYDPFDLHIASGFADVRTWLSS